MRTTLTVDDSLIKEVFRLTKAKTQVEAIRIGLQEFVAAERRKRVLALRGTVNIEDNWQELRARETVNSQQKPSRSK